MPDLAELVSRAARGDHVAFERLWDGHVVRLALCVRERGRGILRGDFGEEDVMQCVAETAWQRLPSFELRRGSSFYRWLVTIADNVMLNRRHYLRGKGRELARELGSARGRELLDPRTSASSLARRREEIARLEEALDALEPKERAVVDRVLWNGRSLRRAAEELGISVATAHARYHAAVGSLNTRLEGGWTGGAGG